MVPEPLLERLTVLQLLAEELPVAAAEALPDGH
jgi:hypothetical protein